MLLASHWRARNLGAVLFLTICCLESRRSRPGRRRRQARRGRVRGAGDRRRDPRLHGAHRDRGPGRRETGAGPFQARQSLRQAVVSCGGHRRLQPGHRTRSQECEGLSRARPKLQRSGRASPARMRISRRQSDWPPTIQKTTPPEAGFVRERETRNPPRPISSRAIKLADKAIEAKQDATRALRARADAYAGIDDYGRALADLEEATGPQAGRRNSLCGSRRDLQPQRRTGQGGSRLHQGP